MNLQHNTTQKFNLEPKKQKMYEECIAKFEDKFTPVGQSLALSTKVHRVKLLETIFASNMSMASATPWLQLVGTLTNQKVESFKSLLIYNPVIQSIEMKKISWLIQNSFPQFSITVDGSPFFASAEVTALTMITKEFKRVTILIRACLLKKTPDAETLLLTTEEAISKVGLPSSNLRAIMADRAATNNAMMNLLIDKRPKNNSVFKAKCNSHTIVKVGEKFEGDALKHVMHNWATAIMHEGHCRELFKNVFDQTPKLGGGVRWYVEYEQKAQLLLLGLENLRDKVVDVCAANKWSVESCTKLSSKLHDPRSLSLAMVELAAQVNAGRIFCTHTYLLESDRPMVFVGYELLNE